jgi:hypothetical protein
MTDRRSEVSSVIAFRAPQDLVAATEAAAVSERISKSDIARRALIRDLGLLSDLRRARHERGTARGGPIS